MLVATPSIAELAERAARPSEHVGELAGRAVHDDLGEQRIEVRRWCV